MSCITKFKVVLVTLLILSFSLPVLAAPLTTGNIVGFSDVTIPAGEHVKSIFLVGGNAHIDGTVEDEVVVVNGNVFLSSAAKVHDHVIVLGGNISAENGAFVREGYFQFGGDFFAVSNVIMAGLIVALLWVVQFVMTVSLLIIPVITLWLQPRLIAETSQIIRNHKMKAVFLGVLSSMASLIIIVLFALSVLGLPIAWLTLFLLFIVAALGLGASCSVIGSNLSGYFNVKERSKYCDMLAGSIFVALVFNIPLIGMIVLCLLVVAGIGGILINLFPKKTVTDES